MPLPTKLERYKGCLLGLAAGDALGVTLEFQKPGSFQLLTDMIGGGPFNLKPGEWTDDTSMALCLAESLIASDGFDPKDQLSRYLRWYRTGYWSSTGKCFDIGNTIRRALHKFETTNDPFCGETAPETAGNGSLMRLAPIPLFYADNIDEVIRYAADSSRTTHAAETTLDACRFYAALIVGALAGEQKDSLLSKDYFSVATKNQAQIFHPEVKAVAAGSYKHRHPPEIRGSGYVVHSLEAALWAFQHSSSFAEGCLMAVNLGEDADTTGAIFGQLAGAFYGEKEIPKHWRSKLTRSFEIEQLAESLLGDPRFE